MRDVIFEWAFIKHAQSNLTCFICSASVKLCDYKFFESFIHFFLLDWFYFKQAFIIVALLYGAIYFMQYASSSLGALVLSAIQLGFFWQQLAFVGHDLGHHVVTHDRKLDDILSAFFGNFLQGKVLRALLFVG